MFVYRKRVSSQEKFDLGVSESSLEVLKLNIQDRLETEQDCCNYQEDDIVMEYEIYKVRDPYISVGEVEDAIHDNFDAFVEQECGFMED